MKTYSFIRFTVLLIVLGISALALPLSAQHYIGLYANGTKPLNSFADSGYRNGGGFSVEYLSPSLLSKHSTAFEIRIGAGIEFSHHGGSNKVKDLVFNTPNNDKGSVKLQNQMFGFYVAPKFIFNVGDFSPYFDITANYRVFNTYQANRFNEEVHGYERKSSTPVIQNGIAHYGGSLGLMYRLSNAVCFDARVTYTTGSAINFADLGTLDRAAASNNSVTYKTITSPVSDVLVFRLGVLFTLNFNKMCSWDTDNNSNNFSPSSPSKKPAELRPPPSVNY